MYPILLSFGPVTLYNFSIFLVLAWILFSFFFWRSLRASGVDEDKIFDLTFYSTIVAFIVARLGFVLFHWDLFSDTWLKIVAIWVAPGLSLYGGLLGGIGTLVSMSRSHKVRLGMVLDALVLSLPIALIVGHIGAFLDGATVGKLSQLPWAMHVAGEVGKRHPISLYQIVALVVIMIVISRIVRLSLRDKRPYGVNGVWFFILYGAIMFVLELFTEAPVYWVLTANQWILVAIFAEAMGALYVRGGGRESNRPIFFKIRLFVNSIKNILVKNKE